MNNTENTSWETKFDDELYAYYQAAKNDQAYNDGGEETAYGRIKDFIREQLTLARREERMAMAEHFLRPCPAFKETGICGHIQCNDLSHTSITRNEETQ